jgi:hypothetical protein
MPELPTRSDRLHLGDAETAFDAPNTKSRTYCGRSKVSVTYWATPELEATSEFLAHVARCGVCRRVAAAKVARRSRERRGVAMTNLPHQSHVGTGRRSDGLAMDRVTYAVLVVLGIEDRDTGLRANELLSLVQAASPYAALETARSISCRFHPLERHGFIEVVTNPPKHMRITQHGRDWLAAS